MKALVTGGAGFIASHIVDAYVELGMEVVVVDNLSRGCRANLNPRARFYEADIRDSAAMRSIFQAEEPDYINHHAAQMDLRRAVHEPVFDAEVNILGSLHLLNLAVEFGIRRFIYASTGGAAYGEPLSVPIAEEHPIRPITPYGISKHTVEHYLFNYRVLYGLDYVVLRYGNVYGPRQSSQGEAGVAAIFCEQMLAGETPRIFGNGAKTRDYIYVSDVARANVQALRLGNGEMFNIATGVPTTDEEVFQAVRAAIGISPFTPRYLDKRPGEIDHCYLNVDKAARQLQWHSEVKLADGLRETAAYFQERHAGAAAR